LPVLCTSVLPCVGKNLEKPVQWVLLYVN
jgi:hypothetical protein